jgi:hypothetical protein
VFFPILHPEVCRCSFICVSVFVGR